MRNPLLKISIAFSFSLLLLAGQAFSQQPYAQRPAIGTLSGMVADSSGGAGLEYATLTLILTQNDSVVGGTLTGPDGKFVLKGIRAGQYTLKADFIGYKAILIPNLSITREKSSLDLGKIYLSPAAVEIGPVEITEQADLVQNGLDKKVFEVEQLITAQGGTATDVLKNLPSVDVDVDGNLSLRGSGNVTVLIDGKPSGLTGGSRAAILEQIPAASIERIEVVNNPSARYDPDGMSGIINIITKKNRRNGMNGGFTLSAGTILNKWNGSGTLSLRQKKFNAYVNYTYRWEDKLGRGGVHRVTYSPFEGVLDQTASGMRLQAGHTAKAGFDYYLTEHGTLYTSVLYGRSTPREPTTLRAVETRGDSLYNVYERLSENEQLQQNIDYTVGYEHRFPQQGHTFLTDFTQSWGWNSESNFYTQNDSLLAGSLPLMGTTRQRDHEAGIFNTTTLRGDYVRPMKHNDRLELGYKAILRLIGRDFLYENYTEGADVWSADTTRSNDFQFREQLYSLYAQYARQFGKFAIQGGVRAEQALTRSNLFTTGDEFVFNYFNLFPSATLARKFGDKTEFKLSYSRRINRPGLEQLNPFPDYQNAQVLRYGNPFIRPEYTHSYDFGVQRFMKKGNFTAAVYYRDLNNMMARIAVVDSLGITRVTFANVAGAVNVGVEGSAEYKPWDFWGLTANFNAYRTWIDGSNVDAAINNSGYSLMGSLISTWIMPHGMNLQLTARQRGPMITPQGQVASVLTWDIAFRKSLFKGQGNISLRVSDLTNRQRFQIRIEDQDFTSEGLRKPESRIGYLSFTWNFGAKDKSQPRRRDEPRQENTGGGGDF